MPIAEQGDRYRPSGTSEGAEIARCRISSSVVAVKGEDGPAREHCDNPFDLRLGEFQAGLGDGKELCCSSRLHKRVGSVPRLYLWGRRRDGVRAQVRTLTCRPSQCADLMKCRLAVSPLATCFWSIGCRWMTTVLVGVLLLAPASRLTLPV